MKTDMTLFEDYQIRRVYDEEAEIWWFSVIDIVQVLTQQADYQTARKLSRVNYLGRFDDNYDGRLSVKSYFALS